MRALGPGSVSSLLKVVVEVVHAALWALLGLQAVAVALLLLAAPFGVRLLHLSPIVLHISGLPGFSTPSPDSAIDPAVLLMVAMAMLYVGILISVFYQLRRVLSTLVRGDPFSPSNVRRLRLVGLALLGLEAIDYALHGAARLFVHTYRPWPISLNATGWFAILVVFVLAEVFREGARLRTEAGLTI